MSLLLENKILQAAEAKLESQLLPKIRRDYMKVVVTGMKVLLNKGPDGPLAQIKHSKDPLGDCAKGAVNLAFLLRKETRGTMPIQAMIPAAMTLMLHGLDFVERIGMMKIGPKELDKATHTFSDMVMRNSKITPNMLKEAGNSARKVMQDPKAVQAMRHKSGVDLMPAPASASNLKG